MNAIYRHFLKSLPDSLRTSRRTQVAFALALMLVIMIVLQLFRFERFPDVLGELSLIRGHVVATVVAIVIVLCEILALPYLFGMPMRRGLRHASALLGLGVFGFWFVVTVWGLGQPSAPGQMTMFGDTLEVPFGVWSAFIAGGLLMASILVVRGRQAMISIGRRLEK